MKNSSTPDIVTMSTISSLANSIVGQNKRSGNGMTPKTLIPFLNAFPAGSYESTVLTVDDALQNGLCVGVDMVHDLTDANGVHYQVRFRYYQGEVEALLDRMGDYGLNGALNEVAIGLEEEVDIAPKGRGNYLHIADRRLKSSTARTTASPPATPSTTSAPPSPPKRGLLGSKRPTVSKPPRNLLAEDDDDDFEDLDFEDDDC